MPLGGSNMEVTSKPMSQSTNFIRFFSVAATFLSAVSLTGQSVIVKISSHYLTIWHIAAGRFFLGLIVLALLAPRIGANPWGHNKPVLFLRGFAGTIGFLCQIRAVQLLPLSHAVILFHLFPIFSALLAIWINREPTPLRDWLFVVGGFLGAMLVLWQTKTTGSFNSGYIIAVVGAFFAGLSLNLVRKLRTNNDFIAPYFYFCLVGAPVSASALFFLGPEAMPDQTGWIALAIVSVLALSAQLLMNYGLKALSAHSSGVILTTQVIMAGFIGIFIFDDPITWRLVVGMVLIICCGVLLTVPRKRRKDQA